MHFIFIALGDDGSFYHESVLHSLSLKYKLFPDQSCCAYLVIIIASLEDGVATAKRKGIVSNDSPYTFHWLLWTSRSNELACTNKFLNFKKNSGFGKDGPSALGGNQRTKFEAWGKRI